MAPDEPGNLRSRQVPSRLDRYPAKMVSRLAGRIVATYATKCEHLLDPFCGSGAILQAARGVAVAVSGMDINPYATLMSGVKMQGFDPNVARTMCRQLIEQAKQSAHVLPVRWEAKHYWFTRATLLKFERIRFAAKQGCLPDTAEGRAVLLAFALSVRRCSRADQRSPKPFISKDAIRSRKGRHFSPYMETSNLLAGLSGLYGRPNQYSGEVLCVDFTRYSAADPARQLKYSHVITSPPYINAQDYYRNFKLELHMLSGILPFGVNEIATKFIGTERGCLLAGIPSQEVSMLQSRLPQLEAVGQNSPRLRDIVIRYFVDMSRCFDAIKMSLMPRGTAVIVCGDNLVGGHTIETWQVLNELLEERGFCMFDHFGDEISCRMLPPNRKGHKGLIKQERVSAFRLTDN